VQWVGEQEKPIDDTGDQPKESPLKGYKLEGFEG